jgi:CheY-like chemotaxis protein
VPHDDPKTVPGAAVSPLVLIVDDNVDYRNTLADALTEEGWRTIGAGDGREALAILTVEHPALMLVDLLMPTMSGLELFQQLRKRPALRGIPVVVITSAADALFNIKLDVPVVDKTNLEDVLRLAREHRGPGPGPAGANPSPSR